MKKTIDNLLVKLDACLKARLWAMGKTWEEIYNTCDRGDWLLWLFSKTNPDNLKELTLAKAKCARTVWHLLKDERSKNAIRVAEKFARGKATKEELNSAADASYAAYAYASAEADADAEADASYAAAYAAYASAEADADADADASYASYAASYASSYAAYAASAEADADADADADAAQIKNQQKTADICRKYLPIELWNLTFDK